MRKRFWLLLIPGLVLTAFSSFNCIFPLISGVTQTCGAPGMVDATFHWIPSTTQGTQYLDVSWYSTFPAGGFLSSGPLDASVNAMTVPGLRTNTVHHWRVNTYKDGAWYTSAIGTFTTAACGTGDGSAPPTGLRMWIPKIGVNAPINVRVIGADGVMGIPNGKDDVVWYDFSGWSGMGGYPGAGGNAVFSGHVDYHPHYEAVFWDLHLVGPGDLIEVDLPDGSAVRYSVQWSKQIGPDDDFTAYAARTSEETITIVTCQGTFNSATHQYDHRLVVRGVRIS
jgi:LPXTG-site transpeptidase (sortase) family protein